MRHGSPGWLLLLGASFAVGAAAAPDPRFGVQTHFAQGQPVRWAGIAAGDGVAGVRDELYWADVEAKRGVFDFPASYDASMAALQAHGLAPLIELDFANPNYDGGDTPYSPAGIAAYARYCAAVLARYGPEIGAVEIWNEYNGTFCSGPARKDQPGTYARMLRRAYARIKAARPGTTVVGGATAGVPLAYWRQLFEDGALGSMDALSIHPYRYNLPPEGIENQVTALQNLAESFNDGQAKPIWVTEMGWQLQPPGDGRMPVSEATQAQYLVRGCALLLSAGVQRIYWYELEDDQNSSLGLYRSDGSARPAAAALRVMLRELAGAAFTERELAADGVYSLLFSRSDGTPLRVLWALRPATIQLGASAVATDLFGHPVGASGSLALCGSPVYVTGPIQGLPPGPSQTPLTDSGIDFSSTQGHAGWWYGRSEPGAAFAPLGRYGLSGWDGQWQGALPFLEISANDQHPSADGRKPVAAVRRWVSQEAGTIHVVGRFQCEGEGGDGVGVEVRVDGRPIVPRTLIGGSSPNPGQAFDFQVPVKAGSTVDFSVDPGPAADIRFDATELAATISRLQ